MRISFQEIQYDVEEEYFEYGGEPFTGIALGMTGGATSDEYEFVDGHLHGRCREYFWNGSLRRVANYVNGRLHGSEEVYFQDGRVRIQAVYEAGSLRRSQEFAENGVKVSEYDWESRIGRDWRLDGSLRKETIYSAEGPSEANILEERFFDANSVPTVVRRFGRWMAAGSRGGSREDDKLPSTRADTTDPLWDKELDR